MGRSIPFEMEKKGGHYWAMNSVGGTGATAAGEESGLVGRIYRHRHPPRRRSEPIVRFDASCRFAGIFKGVDGSGRKEKQTTIRPFWNGRGLVSQKLFLDGFVFSSRQGVSSSE
jgi:hypothetical protein